MNVIKDLVKKYFESLAFFYSHLRYRIFVVLILSILMGVLDGLGLSMFLPLLKMVNDSEDVTGDGMGKLGFLVDIFDTVGIPLNLLSILIFMAFFFFMKGIVQYYSVVYRVVVQQWFIKKIRIGNIKGLDRLRYKYFIKSDIGRIQNTLTGEVDKVAKAFLNYFTAFQFGILVAVYMAFAMFIDFQFSILVIIGGALTNFLYKKLYENTKGLSRKLTGQNSIFQGLVIQHVSNYKYLKATGTIPVFSKKLRDSAVDIEESNKKIGQLDALLMAGREPILITIVVLVIYIQTQLLGSPLGPILISLIFFYRALNYLMQMQLRWNKFLSVSGSLENMTKFKKELFENRQNRGDGELTKSIQQIELKKVDFFYDSKQILDGISLTVNRLETVAFVGESGSGKTTLINIIAGLLPVDTGKYMINGNDFKGLNSFEFQKRIGYITQDPVIFNDSLYNNITLWSKKSEENLRRFHEVIDNAALSAFYDDLDRNHDEMLGSNGVNLSGGQKQRISIARELFKNIELLILDEATSALDSGTEKEIQESILKLKGKYTLFIVAHRLSTIKNADRIVFLNKGRIEDIDSFENLYLKNRKFQDMVKLQEV